MDVNALKVALQQGIVTIDFTKVNGHKRQMLATLETSRLPPPKPGRATIKTPRLARKGA